MFIIILVEFFFKTEEGKIVTTYDNNIKITLKKKMDGCCHARTF